MELYFPTSEYDLETVSAVSFSFVSLLLTALMIVIGCFPESKLAGMFFAAASKAQGGAAAGAGGRRARGAAAAAAAGAGSKVLEEDQVRIDSPALPFPSRADLTYPSRWSLCRMTRTPGSLCRSGRARSRPSEGDLLDRVG